MIPITELRSQYYSIKEEVQQAIQEVLESGWFVLGENVAAFEREFASYCGVRFGIGVGSGTEALHLALLACGIQPGDEVITVPNTAVPTLSAISFAGAIPVLVDIRPDSYNMDPSKIEAKISPRTRAILPVHLFGQAADLDPILEIANKYQLKVVEDACQAHGTEYKGKKVGTFGHAAAFSFYPTKNLGAYGDGGMVVTNDEQVFNKVWLLRNYGQKERYYHSIKGYNSRLDELQAAILRVKLKRLDAWNEARRKLASLYNQLLKESGVVTPQEMEYGKHIYHLYVVRTTMRDKLRDFLQSQGIGTLIHYPIPAHLQESYLDLGLQKGSLPVAERYAEEIVSLPMYPELSPRDVGRVAELIKDFSRSYLKGGKNYE